MAKSKVYSFKQGLELKKRRKAEADHAAFMEFFEQLDEAVGAFKTGQRMPGANAGDSRVSIARGGNRAKFRFEFLARGNNRVEVILDAKDLAANPEEYINNMLECLDEGMKQAKNEDRIIIPVSASQRHLLTEVK